MSEPDPMAERAWESGWQAHQLAQRRRLAALSLAEKLAWLEDAQRLVFHLTRSRKSGPARRRPSPEE